jgi:hypothetical protein
MFSRLQGSLKLGFLAGSSLSFAIDSPQLLGLTTMNRGLNFSCGTINALKTAYTFFLAFSPGIALEKKVYCELLCKPQQQVFK